MFWPVLAPDGPLPGSGVDEPLVPLVAPEAPAPVLPTPETPAGLEPLLQACTPRATRNVPKNAARRRRAVSRVQAMDHGDDEERGLRGRMYFTAVGDSIQSHAAHDAPRQSVANTATPADIGDSISGHPVRRAPRQSVGSGNPC